MQEALQGMEAALREGNSENYRYWSGVYRHWQQLYSEAEADKADAQSRADTAHTDKYCAWAAQASSAHS